MPDSLRSSKPAKSAKPGHPSAGKKSGPKPAGRAGPKPSKGPKGPVRGPRRSDPHAEREAGRYAQPIISREALTEFLSDAPGPMNAEEISRALKLTAPDRLEALSRRLNAMLRDGQLLQNRRGGYAVAAKLDLIAGIVIANPDGFGFLQPEAGGDDLFLPPSEMRKALHGDRVLASVTGVDRRGRREGAIVEVLERRLTRLIGRYSERSRHRLRGAGRPPRPARTC